MPKEQEEVEIPQEQVIKKRVEGIISEVDNLLAHYKLAESIYPYYNLEGHSNVSSKSNYIFREANNPKELKHQASAQ